MDIQTQLRAMAEEIAKGGTFDRVSAAGMLKRAARDIDSLTFTLDQWREEYEGTRPSRIEQTRSAMEETGRYLGERRDV